MTIKTKHPLLGKQSQLFITETCNLRCDECPYPELSKARKANLRRQEMDPSHWKAITDYLYVQGVRLFCLIGGEPCSYARIAEVISNIAPAKQKRTFCFPKFYS